MKKIKHVIIGLAIALGLIIPTNKALASVEYEEAFLKIDTAYHRQVLREVDQAIKEDRIRVAKKNIGRLRELMQSTEELLDEVEKYQAIYRDNIEIRNKIRPYLQNRASYFDIDIGEFTTNKRISDLFLDVAKEDDYFYYGQYGSAKIDTSYNPKKSTANKTYIERASFEVNYRVDVDMEYATTQHVKRWVRDKLDPSLTEYAKVKEIHDYIVKKNFYNLGDRQEQSGGVSIYHPASIVFGNGGVCNAYATLFDLMAKESGLETRFLTGKSIKTGEDHMWNMVKIMGNWYHIDTTWDDPVINFSDRDIENIEDFVIYDYFLKSDAEIKKSRTINENQKRPKAENNFPTSPANSKIEEIDGKFYVK